MKSPLPTTPRAVEARIAALLGELLGIDADEIHRDVSLTEDLAADSLDLLEIALGLEQSLGIALPDRFLDEVRTCGQLVDALMARVRPRSEPEVPVLMRARIRARGWTVERVLPLDAYAAETIADDVVHAGPEADLHLTLLDTPRAGVFAWLGARWATASSRVPPGVRRPDAA